MRRVIFLLGTFSMLIRVKLEALFNRNLLVKLNKDICQVDKCVIQLYSKGGLPLYSFKCCSMKRNFNVCRALHALLLSQIILVNPFCTMSARGISNYLYFNLQNYFVHVLKIKQVFFVFILILEAIEHLCYYETWRVYTMFSYGNVSTIWCDKRSLPLLTKILKVCNIQSMYMNINYLL